MEMASMRALVISILFLASSITIGQPMVTAAVPEEAPGSGGYQFELIHVDANGNFSREELGRRALDRARLRAAMLSAAAQGEEEEEEEDTNNPGSSFSVPVQYSPRTYIMELKMGGDSTAPEMTMLAVADTGSDIIWTNQLTRECIGNPSFTPTNAPCADACRDKEKHCNTCMLTKNYGKKKTMTGFTGKQTMALPTGTGTGTGTAKKKVDLVCAMEWSQKMLPEAGQGVVGLSRGPMSLVTQLGVTQFSYCLRDPLDSKLRSPLWLGRNAQSAAGGQDGWRTTALAEISTEHNQQHDWAKNDYYVVLDEICVGGECSGPLIKKDFWLRSSDAHGGKGLMLVDSGNTYMHLDPEIFEELKSVLHRALGVQVVQNEKQMNCFDHALAPTPAPPAPAPAPTAGKPDLVLKFPGADMNIPWESYVEEGADGFCLYILGTGMSILGNFQQHNVAMLYDLDKKELSFKGVADCGSTN